MKTVAVLGAGSWGTALAVHLAHVGHDVRLWGRDPALVSELATRRENATYLAGIELPPSIAACSALDAAVAGAGCVVAAIPSHGARRVLRDAAPSIERDAIVVSTAKGLEADSMLRASEVVAQELGPGRPVVAVSGPSFAIELARRLPTVVSAASSDANAVAIVQHEFRSSWFRLYGTDDVIGVETGGALKNIIAIAAGVVEGLGLGHNALAALITRGLAEISRLACAAGARRETLAGPSGLGDLVLTCTGELSRNRRVGLELARGRSLEEILAGAKMVAEGVRTTDVALALGHRLGVELPIAAQMAEVLANRISCRAAVSELMLRPQKSETG